MRVARTPIDFQHWTDERSQLQLLPPPLLSNELLEKSGHAVIFGKTNAGRLCFQVAARANLRMSQLVIMELLISLCIEPILAIANDVDRKSFIMD